MKILESIFKGVIIECKCGVTRHVAFSKLHRHVCDCGRCVPLASLTLSDPKTRGQQPA